MRKFSENTNKNKITDFFTKSKNVVQNKRIANGNKIDRRALGKKKLPSNFYNKKCIADRKMGDEGEIIISKLLKNWFKKSKFKEDKKGWKVIDYMDYKNKYCAELKCRRTFKNQYDTIMIGKNKFTRSSKMMKNGYKAFFIFKFKDAISFYPVPETLPNSIYIASGGTDKRGKREYSDCLYIPTKLLFDFKDFKDYQDFKDKN
jgi:hypothetical protein